MSRHHLSRLTGLIVLWVVVALFAPFVGTESTSPADLLGGEATAQLILWQLRVPRVLLGLLAGGALAVAGVALQGLFRNPLAEPYTLGVASGASLGAVLALRLGVGRLGLGLPAIGVAAFAGAVAVSLLLVGLASRPRVAGAGGLLLAGVAISLSCSAFILFLQYLADSTQTYRMVRWMMGGLSVVGFAEVLWLAPWVLAGTATLVLFRRELDLMLGGREVAASRGVQLPFLRTVVLGTASLMVGALVAVAGPIGFVGLVVPHTLRRWFGAGHGLLLLASFLGGGAFLTLCDAAARRIMAPAEIPVGVLTALLGGPFFLALLLRGRGTIESP